MTASSLKIRSSSKKKKQAEPESKQDEDQNEDDQKEKVANKFSFIPCEYNDLTNLYLTSRCLVPSLKKKGDMYGVADTQFALSAHFHKQLQWHKHPKLRVYQYLNGGGMRFFESHDDIDEGRYEVGHDLVKLWPEYFQNTKDALSAGDVAACDVFDGVLDLYKCDAQFFQWDNAIKRAQGKK